ncbi:hypothetical protein niasHS_000132 [Heterodera schachtii]|uniref:Uncharacterized protein n=1 Tax=Heterodera schachtii TaxID=97005 RepID=A0ABD2K6R8_HETSC
MSETRLCSKHKRRAASKASPEVRCVATSTHMRRQPFTMPMPWLTEFFEFGNRQQVFHPKPVEIRTRPNFGCSGGSCGLAAVAALLSQARGVLLKPMAMSDTIDGIFMEVQAVERLRAKLQGVMSAEVRHAILPRADAENVMAL